MPERFPPARGVFFFRQERWIITQDIVSAESTRDPHEARQFAIDAARLLAQTRCHNVAVLEVSGISPVTDFLVIATGTSARQMKSAADEVEELGLPRNFKPLSRVGDAGSTWIVLDLVDVVIHVFSQDARLFYDLDSLWGDAPKLQWRQGDVLQASAAQH